MTELVERRVRIQRVSGAHFHVLVRDGVRLIDENVDAPKLMAMLKRLDMVNTRGEAVAAEDVLYRLDSDSLDSNAITLYIRSTD